MEMKPICEGTVPDPERDAFESWCIARWNENRGMDTFRRHESGPYLGAYLAGSVQFAWSVWQGATQAERARVLAKVKQRLLTWRQSTINRSGDHLALDDFMGAESIKDLMDYVCDPFS